MSLASSGAPIWTNITGDAGGWKESPWFGWFASDDLESGWAYSWPHGWIWLQGPGEDNLWIWDFELNWTWTSRNVYPFMYISDRADWLYYAINSRQPRWFYEPLSDQWIQVGAGNAAPATTTPEIKTATASTALPALAGLSDGSFVEMPPLNEAVGFTLGRESHAFAFETTGLMTTGSMRTLEIDSSASLDAELALPLVALPLAELGTLDRKTINLMRVETVQLPDGSTEEQVAFLPATYRPDGTVAARDYLMPETVSRAREVTARSMVPLDAGVPENGRAEPVPRPKVKYIASSFSGSLNYKRQGQLIRMIPDPGASGWRRPFDELDFELREKEDRKWVQNIVVLVHGHNEEEKGGIYEASAERPWYFAYKRDVWTLFYRFLCENYFRGAGEEQSRLGLEDTIRFYEFVYPSYRGVFDDLDKQLASQIELEVARQVGSGMPVNIVIIAHSMGGLVSRAAVQQLSPAVDACIRKVITWGTPHMGSPLVTMRYVLASDIPYDFNIPENSPVLAALANRTQIYSWGNLAAPVLKSLLRKVISGIQMDAPGTRDLRYVRRPMQEESFRLGLENLFALSAAQMTPENQLKYDLQNGSAIYNYNLQIMNQTDRHLGDGVYFPCYGKTSKRLEFTKTDSFPWFTVSNWDVGTAQGATIMPFLVADADETVTFPFWPASGLGGAGESDGAVNVPSMVAAGVAKWGGHIFGADHEEYFGSPDASGTFTAESKGNSTASYTIRRMFGGESDPAYAYDRDGVMYPPELSHGFGLAYGVWVEGYKWIYDVGYANEVDFLVRLNFFDEEDPLHDAPFAIFDTAAVSILVGQATPDGKLETIPVFDGEVNPSNLPLFTSNFYYEPDGDPGLFMGKIDIRDMDLSGKLLYVDLKAKDGTHLTWPVPFLIRKRSPAGTWKLDLRLANNGSGNDTISDYLNDLPLEFDGAGNATLASERENNSGSFAEDGTGWTQQRKWTWEGNASIENNVFHLYAQLTQELTTINRSWVGSGDNKSLKTITEESVAVGDISFEANMTGWLHNLSFYSGSEIVTKGYALSYRKTTDVDGIVSESISESYDGDLTYTIDLEPPPEGP
jgi:hypothetical protein